MLRTVGLKARLRVDIHAAAATSSIEHRGGDRTVRELDDAVRICCDLDDAATGLVSLGSYGTVRHHQLVACRHVNVTCIAWAGAACRDLSAIGRRPRRFC